MYECIGLQQRQQESSSSSSSSSFFFVQASSVEQSSRNPLLADGTQHGEPNHKRRYGRLHFQGEEYPERVLSATHDLETQRHWGRIRHDPVIPKHAKYRISSRRGAPRRLWKSQAKTHFSLQACICRQTTYRGVPI